MRHDALFPASGCTGSAWMPESEDGAPSQQFAPPAFTAGERLRRHRDSPGESWQPGNRIGLASGCLRALVVPAVLAGVRVKGSLLLFIFLFLVIGLIGLLSLFWALAGPTDEEARSKGMPSRRFGAAAAVLLLFIQVGWAAFNSFHQIDAQQVGVVREFGKITGQISEGPNFTVPWANVETWDIRTQTIVPETTCSNSAPDCMDAGSIDVQDVYVTGALNIAVSPVDVQLLSRTVGPNYVRNIVLDRWYQVVKQVISRYKAEDILAARPEIRTQITEQMQQELDDFSITVVDFQLTNIAFTPGFSASIEAKVQAEVEAATEQNRVEISIAQARQAEEVAKGQANAAIAAAEGTKQARILIAEGEAEANRLLEASLSPQVLQWQAINQLADNIQFGLLPGDIPLLLQPFDALQQQPAVAP